MKLFLESKFDLVPVMHVLKDATGGNKKVKSSEFLDSGHIAIVDQSSDCLISGYSNDKSLVFKTESPVIIFGDHTRVVKYIEFPFILGADGTKALIPKNQDENDAKFLYYQLKSLRIPSAGYSRHFKFLKEEKLAIPPLPEQQRIADILDKAEAINQKREQALALCDEFLRATFLDMFGDPVSNPKGWVYEKLDEVILSIKAGKSLAGDSKPANENELGVLKVSAVSYGFFQPQENKKIEKLVDREKLIFPKKGDFLFSRANTRELVGATCIVQDDFGHVFLPDKLWLIDVDSEKVSAYYLHFLMLEPKFKDKLTSQATGTSGSMLNISQKKFVNTIAPIPPIELQQKFSSIVEKVNAIKARIQHAQELPLFEALSQQAFKGELTL